MVEGDNVLAVEIHQADADSNDISFDLAGLAPAVDLFSGGADVPR